MLFDYLNHFAVSTWVSNSRREHTTAVWGEISPLKDFSNLTFQFVRVLGANPSPGSHSKQSTNFYTQDNHALQEPCKTLQNSNSLWLRVIWLSTGFHPHIAKSAKMLIFFNWCTKKKTECTWKLTNRGETIKQNFYMTFADQVCPPVFMINSVC